MILLFVQLLEAVAAVLDEAIFEGQGPAEIVASFPADFHKSLKQLIAAVITKNLPTWKETVNSSDVRSITVGLDGKYERRDGKGGIEKLIYVSFYSFYVCVDTCYHYVLSLFACFPNSLYLLLHSPAHLIPLLILCLSLFLSLLFSAL